MNCFRYACCLIFVVALATACQKPGAVSPEIFPPQQEISLPAESREILGASEPEQSPVVESVFGRHLTLQGLIENALKTQYFSWESLLEPPLAQFAENMLIQLQRQEVRPFLAKGVTAYAGNEKGLAVAFENGQIMFFSDWECSGLSFPGTAEVLAWSPESRLLVSLDQSRLELRVFDVQLCGEVLKQTMTSGINQLALSRTGKHLACVDKVHGLFLSSLPNPLRNQAALRYDTLVLAFTPQEEVLLIVDQGGWVTLLDSTTGKELDIFFIPGGPFVEAILNGRSLQLTNKLGETKALDMVTREPIAFKRSQERFALEEGVLYYLTRQERYVRRMHLNRPEPAVWYSATAKAFKVKDIDSRVRYYSAESGEQLSGVDSDDWMAAPLSKDTNFTMAGREYRLAEIVRQKDGLTLLCRAIPDSGFFLWWVGGIAYKNIETVPGALPQRYNLLAERGISWNMLPGNQVQETATKEMRNK